MKIYPQEVMEMLDSGYIKFCHTVSVALDFPLRFTDAGFDIEYGGVKYDSSGSFQGVDALTSTAEMRVSSINLAFSMINTAVTAAILGGDVYKRPVTIMRHYLSDDFEILFSEVVWRGTCSGKTDSDKDAQISIEVSSRWAEFERVNAHRTSTLSHQKRAGLADDCMKYAAKAGDTIYWAGKAGA